ncbi:MAG: flippase [Lacunisphaera sp.]
MSEEAGKASRLIGQQTWINFGWLMMDRLGRILIAVVASIAVARYLGPVDFGVLSFALALTGIVTVFTGLGLEEIMVRDLAHEHSAAVWQSAWRLRLLAAAIGYALTVTAAWLWRPGSPEVWKITAIVAGGLFFAPCDLIDFWFQARQRIRPPTLARQLVLWSGAAWRLALVAAHAPLVAFAWVSVAEAAMVGAALFWTFRREQWRPEGGASEMGRLLREGWPLTISGLLVILTMQSDRLLLGWHGGDAAVGVYVAAARLTEVMYAVPVALGAALMPRLALLYGQDNAGYRVLTRRIFLGLFGAALVFSAVASLLAPWLIPLMFGPSYAESARILRVHSWILLSCAWCRCARVFLSLSADPLDFFHFLLTAAFNLSANLILIPPYGGLGAAWAALAHGRFRPWSHPGCFRHPQTHLEHAARKFLGLACPSSVMEFAEKDLERSKLSVVDDAGTVFFRENKVLRAVREEAADKIRALLGSGLLDALADRGWIPRCRLASVSITGYALVIEQDRLPVVTYPYEWTYACRAMPPSECSTSTFSRASTAGS